MKKRTLGKKHRISSSNLLFAARLIHEHLTGNRLAQAALTVQSYRDSLFELISCLKLAAAYEEQEQEANSDANFLLKALQDLLNACEYWEDQNDSVLVNARTAIAKTKGETHDRD